MKIWFRAALPLALIFSLSVALIRARPYDDRALRALAHDGCPAPCFLGIRPGVTPVNQGMLRLVSHDWVATRLRDFPPPVEVAVAYNASISRFVLPWRWSAARPEWIDAARGGTIVVENRDVLGLMIDTRLTLGEIMLAFGAPDEAQFVAASSGAGRGFLYSAWYGREGMLVSVEGPCPTRRYHDLPVRLIFRPQPPDFSDAFRRAAVCR